MFPPHGVEAQETFFSRVESTKDGPADHVERLERHLVPREDSE